MESYLHGPTKLSSLSSISVQFTACSTKFINVRTTHSPDSSFNRIRLLNRSSDPSSNGLQKDKKKDLSRILRTDAAIKAIERKANSKKYNNLWPKAVLEGLDEAIKNNLWQSALKIFELLRKQHWYEPRTQTYAKLLIMLSKTKQPKEATILFQIMLSEGLKPTPDVYTALISAYGQSGLFHKAFSILNEMKSVSDSKPDVYTYSILITSCFKFHRIDLVKKLLVEMSYLGIEYNTVIYNTIIDGYGKAKMLDMMENSLSEMLENGSCLPDIFTLNSLIGAYGNNGQTEKMEKWYNEFQLMNINADIRTFNILIRSYGKARMYTKMGSVMDYMEKRFFSPTIVTFNTVIEVFGRNGNIDKMEEFFKIMKHQGVKPNSVTYCSLISAYSKAGQIEKVDSIMRQVENSDVVLDTPFFNCVINAYGQIGDVKRMRELFSAMKERRCLPDSITYATVIDAYNARGMIEAAQSFKSKFITTREKQ